ncbi:YhcN/YlaJ family sporulation lipoprotein [Anaerobacterium chartisolvens]|uniref:YhcN/YlaJ family sporulation lipoprotein n=1 Tax=Anaerobacterium chartisolvens TaxID=1297424 RepID=A0A369ATB8_9FIRM|nr:YhcN/YlaJ family sporulation lipoprotein [Anaerobacterium chartisolvens]RCX12325.1 YhcN/YlaJ family sporulation lipoprotein [Anaerobacterium chartisolvens]
MRFKNMGSSIFTIGTVMMALALTGCNMTGTTPANPNSANRMGQIAGTDQRPYNGTGANGIGTNGIGANNTGTIGGIGANRRITQTPGNNAFIDTNPGSGIGTRTGLRNNTNNTGLGAGMLNGNTGTGRNMNNTQTTSFDQAKATGICNQLEKMNGIRDANAVVNGDTAIVSCKASNPYTDINAMRDTIVNRVKQFDSSIRNVVLTDETDAGTKIQQLANDITNNRPVNDLRARFNQMMQEMGRATR